MDILTLAMWHMEIYTLIFVTIVCIDFAGQDNTIGGILSFFSVGYTIVKIFSLLTFKIADLKGNNMNGLKYALLSLLMISVAVYLINILHSYLSSKFKFKAFYILLRIKLSKNYNNEHRNVIFNLGYTLIRSGEFKEQMHSMIADSKKDEPSWSSSYHRTTLIDLIVKFFNTIVDYSDDKDNAKLVETTLLQKDNIQTLAFILNVFEDKDKTKFILSADGQEQRVSLINDVKKLNEQVEKNVGEIKDLARKTHKNKMNAELNALKNNKFDKIEEMKK